MKKETLLDALGDVNEKYLAESEKKKHSTLQKTCTALAACLALALITMPFLKLQESEPFIPTEYPLIRSEGDVKVTSMETPAPAKGPTSSTGDSSMVYLSPEAIVRDYTENIFRGRILRLENLEISFGGKLEYRARAVIRVEESYMGSLAEGTETTILLPPFFYFAENVSFSAYSTVAEMEEGMEGIFFTKNYTEESFSEYNGTRLYLLDLADGYMFSGECSCILKGKDGLIMENVTWGEGSSLHTESARIPEDASLREAANIIKKYIPSS